MIISKAILSCQQYLLLQAILDYYQVYLGKQCDLLRAQEKQGIHTSITSLAYQQVQRLRLHSFTMKAIDDDLLNDYPSDSVVFTYLPGSDRQFIKEAIELFSLPEHIAQASVYEAEAMARTVNLDEYNAWAMSTEASLQPEPHDWSEFFLDKLIQHKKLLTEKNALLNKI